MYQNLTLIPFDFAGKVYRTPLPYSAYDFSETTFDELIEAQVDVYYSLVEPEEWIEKASRDSREAIRQAGIQRIDYPIEDFYAPTQPEQFAALVAEAYELAVEGKNIAVHCHAGIGRTGLFLAEMTIQHYGWRVGKAVRWLRKSIPSAVENEYQYQFLLDLHQKR